MSNKHALWVEKYRPETLNDYIFHDVDHKEAFQNMIANQSIPHLLLSGVQGTGKTTIAKILTNAIGLDNTDILAINASDQNNVDVVRERIRDFISTYAMGPFKVVLLEEADRMTPQGQDILKGYMEDYNENARFILTCNHENRIVPPVKSRCQHFRFKTPNVVEITEFVAKILISEHIKFDIQILDEIVSVGYPDIRKMVNMCQQYSMNGILTMKSIQKNESDYKFKMLDLLERDKWEELRLLLIENVTNEEWEEIYTFLYRNLHKSPKFKTRANWEQGQLIIAERLEKNMLYSDPEINFTACSIQLGAI